MATNGAPEPERTPPQNRPAGGGARSGGGGIGGGGGGGGIAGVLGGIPTKYLIIAGGGIGGVLLLAAAAAVLFLFILGGGSPQPGSIMDLVPARADGVAILNIKAIQADDYLTESVLEARYASSLDDLEDSGIDRDSIEQMILVAEDSRLSLYILQASFDPEDIQYALEDDDEENYEEDDYRGYTIWVGSSESVAMLEGGYIVGGFSERSVRAALNNLYQGEGALSNADDDNNLKRILDKLGSGITIFADVSNDCGNWNDDLERCEGYGTVLTEADADREQGNFKYVALFRNERSAEETAGRNYDSLDDFFVSAANLDIDDAEADGEFVTGAGSTDWGDRSSSPDRDDDNRRTTSSGSAAPTATSPPEGRPTEAPYYPAATSPAVATAAPTAMSLSWVEDCEYNKGLSPTECSCLHDELETILSGTGMEIPELDSPEWWDDDFALPRGYVEAACY